MELILCVGGAWALAARFSFGLPPIVGQIAAISCRRAALFRRSDRRALSPANAKRIRRPHPIRSPRSLPGHRLGRRPGSGIGQARPANQCNLGPFDLARDIWHGGHGDPGILLQDHDGSRYSWLKRYAPVAGKERVPRLEELYSRRLAVAGWALWAVAVLGTSISLIAGWPHLSLIAAPLLAALVCFLINVVAISRHWITGVRLPRPHVSAVHRPI